MSRKTEIIENIFRARWDEQTRTLRSATVTLRDISEAIAEYNQANPDDPNPLSTRNPANFFKDLIRNQQRANANWPRYVWEQGYTAVQVTTNNRCFDFVPISPGQTVPFPRNTLPLPDQSTPRVDIESVSVPLASRRLGRTDEPWLIQVIVRLRVLETHLALSSSLNVVQLDHLQTNVKLAGSEIDALFLGVRELALGSTEEFIVCAEAKGRRDDVIPAQILAEVRAAYAMGIEQNMVVPMAVKAIAPSEVWVIEFSPVTRENAESTTALTVATSAVYRFVPRVPGVGL